MRPALAWAILRRARARRGNRPPPSSGGGIVIPEGGTVFSTFALYLGKF